MNKTIAALAAVCAFSTAASAHTLVSDRLPPSAAISTAQTDFRDPASVKVLYGKLVRAARDVCTSEAIDRFATRDADQACIQHTLDGVVGKANRPLLTALHQERTSRTAFAQRD